MTGRGEGDTSGATPGQRELDYVLGVRLVRLSEKRPLPAAILPSGRHQLLGPRLRREQQFLESRFPWRLLIHGSLQTQLDSCQTNLTSEMKSTPAPAPTPHVLRFPPLRLYYETVRHRREPTGRQVIGQASAWSGSRPSQCRSGGTADALRSGRSVPCGRGSSNLPFGTINPSHTARRGITRRRAPEAHWPHLACLRRDQRHSPV